MTRQGALSYALFLSLTAPSDVQTKEAVKLAEQIASGMTEEQVEAAKASALQLVENMEAA